jgi:biopolymer transport protein ExbD
MRFRRNKSQRRISVIETTPLVNVVFLLLIFFLLSMGLPLRLNEVNHPSSMIGSWGTPTSNPVTVVVLPEQIILNGKPVSEQTLSELPRNRDITILASRDIPYFKVINVLDVLRASGHTRLSLATKPLQN